MKFEMNKPANFQVAKRLDEKDMTVPTYLSIAKTDILLWADRYVDHIDLSVTQEVCKCEWIINPDDLHIRPMCCRSCQHPRERHKLNDQSTAVICKPHTIEAECDCSLYMPRRVRLGEQNPLCPVHTPIGRILGFFEFVFGQDSKEDESKPDTMATESALDEDQKGIAEHCYREGCNNWITGASDYCSEECEQAVIRMKWEHHQIGHTTLAERQQRKCDCQGQMIVDCGEIVGSGKPAPPNCQFA